jgi:hypothetical protein
MNILVMWLNCHVANWRCGNKPRGRQLATWPIEHVTKILNLKKKKLKKFQFLKKL